MNYENTNRPPHLALLFLPGLILLWMLLHIATSRVTLAPVTTREPILELDQLVKALGSGSIPSEEEILAWEGLLQRLKNQSEAGVPLSEEQIEQLQRLYNLTAAYVPWLENFFELLKALIQQITLSNAALEMELNDPPNFDTDE